MDYAARRLCGCSMANAVSALHFAEPAWLWGLVFLAPVALWLLFSTQAAGNPRIRRYADAELLPHLLQTHAADSRSQWLQFGRWAALWSLIVIAMAGPRWDFADVQLFNPGSNLVVLFDISRSMEVADVQPRRLARARQEIEDLLDQNRGARVGLIAFASVSHVVSPITEDTEGIRRLLPALVPDLVKLQGSRLSAALDRAGELLASQAPESGKSILLISDGDFAEQGLEEHIRTLAAQGIRLHILGVGTPEGGRVPMSNGKWLYAGDRRPVISRLNESYLQTLARQGDGIYQRAEFRDGDTRAILSRVEDFRAPQTMAEGRTRVWHERFYWLVGFGLLLLLPWFRRSAVREVRRG